MWWKGESLDTTWATLIVQDNTQILFDKVRAVEEMLRQTEEDADKEILEMKTSYEIELKREAESNVKIRLGHALHWVEGKLKK